LAVFDPDPPPTRRGSHLRRGHVAFSFLPGNPVCDGPPRSI
jgi:hypothetical protein